MPELLKDHESARAQRALQAVLRMKKLDIGELQRIAAASGLSLKFHRSAASDGACLAVLAARGWLGRLGPTRSGGQRR
jgi:hypothetical protein